MFNLVADEILYVEEITNLNPSFKFQVDTLWQEYQFILF